MGAAASSLSKSDSLTGDQFMDHKQTKELNAMSDALFQFMYSKWELRDIFDIAEKPGDYVIAISDLITSQFHVLGYTTKRNKIGEIYFEKWDDLDPPKTAAELGKIANSTRKEKLNSRQKKYGNIGSQAGTVKHGQHARIIAFYFVRIFQILGSLLLVIKDTDTTDLTKYKDPSSGLPNSARAFTNQSFKVLPRFRPPSRGGSDTRFPVRMPLGPYEFLREYLRTIDENDIQTYRKYKLELAPYKNLFKFKNFNLFFEYTEPAGATMIGTKSGGTKQRFGMFVKKSATEAPFMEFIDVLITELFPDSIEGYKAPSDFEEKERFRRYPMNVKLQFLTSTKGKVNEAEFIPSEVQSSGKSYSNGIQYILKSGSLFESLSSEFDLNTQFVDVLEKMVGISIRKVNQGKFNIIILKKPEEKETRDKTGDSSGKLEVPKHQPVLEETFKELKPDWDPEKPGERHVPFCIARALDLLDAASINGNQDKPATTRICSSKISGTGNDYKPLKSLGQLYGKIDISKTISVDPKDFQNATTILEAFVGEKAKGIPIDVDTLNKLKQVPESNELAAAIEKLKIAFHSQINTKPDTQYKSFGDIKLDKPEACSTKNELVVERGGPAYSNMQLYSQRLLAAHLNSVIDISKFLKTIFNVSQRPDGSWKVDGPKTELLFAGFDTLDDLTDQARGLLVNYYSKCEVIYQTGVKTWASHATKPAVNSSSEKARELKEPSKEPSRDPRINVLNPDPREPAT